MNIFSEFSRDSVRDGDPTGGYEWWYFDAVSADEKYSFVIILYRGNPFSRRYIDELESEGANPRPSSFPAISISVYENADPIYYSFTEFKPQNCSFGKESPSVQIGPHRMEGRKSSGSLEYQLSLQEQLASGDQLKANLTFKSPVSADSLFSNDDGDAKGHAWNLVQPQANVEGTIHISGPTIQSRETSFEGEGYHDHNTGDEPMRDEFVDWYWGRFHFSGLTLVYYLMNKEEGNEHRAWIINKENGKVMDELSEVKLEDQGRTLFGLQTARRITLGSQSTSVQIQHHRLLDNGPFYQRFMSDAFLQIPDSDLIESQSGICEYIHPDQIYNRLFWPFVNMRIRYMAEKPHWVQRLPKLYRWTW